MRTALLFGLLLVLAPLAVLHAGDTVTSSELDEIIKSLKERYTELQDNYRKLEFGSLEKRISNDVKDTIQATVIRIEAIQDMLMIETIIKSESDKKNVGIAVDKHIQKATVGIDESSKYLDDHILRYSKDPGIVATTTKLKYDLRDLNKLLGKRIVEKEKK